MTGTDRTVLIGFSVFLAAMAALMFNAGETALGVGMSSASLITFLVARRP